MLISDALRREFETLKKLLRITQIAFVKALSVFGGKLIS
jgi:hypothetical protein